MAEERKAVAVDFDGVIHQWDGEFRGHHVCQGLPITDPDTGVSSIDWMHLLLQTYDIFILTTRGETFRGRMGVRLWLRSHTPDSMWHDVDQIRGLRRVRVTNRKTRALMYIDDRAFRFEGNNFPSANRVRAMRPWWKELVRG